MAATVARQLYSRSFGPEAVFLIRHPAACSNQCRNSRVLYTHDLYDSAPNIVYFEQIECIQLTILLHASTVRNNEFLDNKFITHMAH